jgi:transcriptional regulator with XRE-family HTH domain
VKGNKNLHLVSFVLLKDTFSLHKTRFKKMGAVHNKIKKLRSQVGLTQQHMADKMNMHLKTWQKIENGITKLDIERLKEIAEVLETTVEDLINADDGVYINEIKGNDVGFNNNNVTINHKSETEKELYERLISEKDKIIEEKNKEIAFYRDLLGKK